MPTQVDHHLVPGCLVRYALDFHRLGTVLDVRMASGFVHIVREGNGPTEWIHHHWVSVVGEDKDGDT